MSDTRLCYHCGEVKPVAEFSIDRRSRGGYQGKCKACVREYRVQHIEEIRIKKAQYYQEHREEIIRSVTAYSEEHHEETLARVARYAEKYPDRVRGYKRKYIESENGKNHRAVVKRRRRVNGGYSLEVNDMVYVKDEYGGYCPYCNQKIDDGHIDHIVPVIKGGTNDRDNLVYCCATCNMSKGSKSLLEFMIYRAMAA